MLFVSNFNNYQFLVQRDLTRRVPSSEGDDSGWVSVVVRPQIMLQFKSPGHLTFHQRQKALEFFDQRDSLGDGLPPGPYRTPGHASDPDFEGYVYEGSDHWLMFSTFNTETDCPWVDGMEPEKVREMIETSLSNCAQLGQDYILIEEERMPAPWPNFDETHHKQIPVVTRALKLDPRVVIAYLNERDSPPVGVIADLEKLAAEQVAEEAAIENLTVRG